MLTYSRDQLQVVNHDWPPYCAVRKSLFRSHPWRPVGSRLRTQHSSGLVLALTETWHGDSDDSRTRLAVPTGFAVMDAARQSGCSGSVAVIFPKHVRCSRVQLPYRRVRRSKPCVSDCRPQAAQWYCSLSTDPALCDRHRRFMKSYRQ